MQNLAGPRIAKLRRERGISQKDLALQLGVAPPTLSQWEHGIRPFPRERLETAAAVLKIDAKELDIDQPLTANGSGGRRPQLRPAYPPGATVEQVASMGPAEWDIHERVRAQLDTESYRVVVEELPRDTRYELLLCLKFLVMNSSVQLSSPGRRRCPIHTMHDLMGGVGDHLLQPVIVWRSKDERITIFSQVWINVSRHAPVRVDFLIYYRPPKGRGYWLYVEIDDESSHKEKRYYEQARTLALALPGLRYENHLVSEPWFLRRLLTDIRSLKTEARRRRLENLRRARRFERQRQAHAASRRNVA